MKSYKEEYSRWLEKTKTCEGINDPDIYNELKSIENNDDLILDAFYRELEFGTAGLRGVLGAGTNRINVYVVGRTTRGLANYIIKNYPEDKRIVAISYDSRHKSKLFAKIAASVLAAAGVKVYIYNELMPTPLLSYAVRYNKAAAGIMVTASHNAAKYNGYKVYDDTGCQITTEAANAIMAEIEKIDYLDDIEYIDFEKGLNMGIIELMGDDVLDSYCNRVLQESVLGGFSVEKKIPIVYSPLCGTGLKPVMKVLKAAGFTNVLVVPEQKEPNGDFPTCPIPNPENSDALELGIKHAKETNAELVMATDPDSDRIGIAVRNKEGEYQLLTGNEVGVLLFDFLCLMRIKAGRMPAKPIVVKTIVSTMMVEDIAERYNVQVKNVLTGFKYIGEQIKWLEEKGEESRYIFGFEESYGYLSGPYVRDKDAVDAALLIVEMVAYYKTMGLSLLERMDNLYWEYGYRLNVTHSYTYEGASGFAKMEEIMEGLRKPLAKIGKREVLETLDYKEGIDDLPKSDVMFFKLSRGATVIIRPSGTEPKIKVYISVVEESKSKARIAEEALANAISEIME